MLKIRNEEKNKPKCFVFCKHITIFAPTIKSYMAKGFELVMLEEAKKFVLGLPQSAMKKVLYNAHRIASGEQNAELFKKLEGSDIWEFRTLYNGIQYRLFAFWDTSNNALVVSTHGIVKKTQKTPPKEIVKAERIRIEYFKEKGE